MQVVVTPGQTAVAGSKNLVDNEVSKRLRRPGKREGCENVLGAGRGIERCVSKQTPENEKQNKNQKNGPTGVLGFRAKEHSFFMCFIRVFWLNFDSEERGCGHDE